MKSALRLPHAVWPGAALLSLALSGCGNGTTSAATNATAPARTAAAAHVLPMPDDRQQSLWLLADRINASASSALTGLPAATP